MNAKEILEDINRKISNRDIFKYNREFLVASLIQLINKSVNYALLMTMRNEISDQIIEQFRAILKFIFINDNINGPIPINEDEIIYQLEDIIAEFVSSYTPIRNYLEQCDIGTRKIEYNEKENLYIEKEYDNTSDYARTIDKVRKDDSEEIKNNAIKTLGNYLIKNKKADIFKDRYIMKVIDYYIEASWIESEIKFEYKFEDFKYSELITFCAALKLLGQYYLLMQFKYPYGKIEKEKLIYGLTKLTDLEREKIEKFLKYQTYDFEYQKDKLTLIQSLIFINGYYYFSPITLTIGILPIKMYRLICDYDRKKYEKDISFIAKQKEEQMTDDIIEILSQYNVSIVKNYQYKECNKIKAEYDLLILDNDTNNLYIAEFKWFFVGDGEEEHNKLDNKIEQAVKDRKSKDKFIFVNKNEFGRKVFGVDKINEVKEILISQNYIGKRNFEMPVIDFETLKVSVYYNNTFEELMNYIYSKKYIESIQLENVITEIKIEDYKFKIYRLVKKCNN